MDELVFVHIPKTGGTSIRTVLGLPHDHATAAEYVERLGLDKWRRRLTFAVARHPFDRFVSAWAFLVGMRPGRPGWQKAQRSREVMLSHGTMDAFIRAGAPAMFEVHAFQSQIQWLVPMPRLLLRFESLEDQFQFHFGQQLPHVNASERQPWRETLSPEQRSLLAQVYAADFKRLGYETES